MVHQRSMLLTFQLLAVLVLSSALVKSTSAISLPLDAAEQAKINDELRTQAHIQEEKITKLQHMLTKLVITLLDGKADTGNEEDEHVIRRRDTDSNEDILSKLPIEALAGLRGQPGKDGKDGRDGRDGNDGRDGKDGQNGINGINGKDGRDGIGKDGIGKDGRDGINGKDGVDGKDGTPGRPGTRGPDGTPGNNGTDGTAGSPGSRGLQGMSGTNGRTGSPGRNSTATAGAVYTRWARTTCENSSSLLYHGFAAGNKYTETGGGVNYQCLPLQPEYNRYGSGGSASNIGGVEFEVHDSGIFPNSAHHRNVPCARCYSQERSAMMMLPARRTCPTGWISEFEGYLMTAYSTHNHPSTYECVDASPEFIAGMTDGTHGSLFYFTRPICSGEGNTGHCPPYVADRQLTCVVCTK